MKLAAMRFRARRPFAWGLFRHQLLPGWGLALSLGLMVVAVAPVHGAPATRAVGNYLIDFWETEDGLPENSANAMVQTPDGYLWFGTFNGLVRFNGVAFTVFDPRNTPQLPGASIVNLHLDQADRLWISTDRGIAIRSGKTWKTLGVNEGWTGDYVRTFSENAGVLCLTSFDGRVYRAEKDRLVELPVPPGNQAGYFGHVDPAGVVWVAQDGFFGRWDGQRWSASDVAAEVRVNFKGLGAARNGDALVVSRQALLRIRGDRVVSRLPLPQDTGGNWRIYEDSGGAVWLCTRGAGLWKVSPSGPVERFSLAEGLVHEDVRFAFEDREKNLWAGSSGGGLMRFKPRTFVNYSATTGRTIYPVKAVAEDSSGKIVFGTYGPGLAELDAAGQIKPLPREEGRGPAAYVQCLLVDRNGRTWVGNYNDSLQIRSPAGIENVNATDSGGTSTTGLFEDSRGRVWIGGNLTVSLFNDGVFRPFAVTVGLPLAAVRTFAEDPVSGDIWAATSNGLFRHGAGGWKELKDEKGASLTDTTCLRTEADGTLWVGGTLPALRRWRAGQWAEIAPAQGLPVDAIASIVDDGLGYWWCGSNRGVVRLSRSELERAATDSSVALNSQIFNLSDGLASVECAAGYSSTAMKDRRGRLWFATLKGLASVDPATFRLNTAPAPVAIEKFRIENRTKGETSLPLGGGEPLVVPPDQREIAVFFACLSYVAPEKARFAYRIDGLHGDWQEIKRRTSLYFFPPEPGAYRFRIKATNNDGVWSDQEASVAFVVQPHFWQTLWFRLGVGLGVVLAVAGLFRQRSRRSYARHEELRLINEELDRRVQARTAELAQRVTEVERLNGELSVSQDHANRSAANLQTVNANLITANQELEAFSYSVSHDLRAPLRNINGFLELLMKRVGGQIDPEAQRFVATVSKEAARMGLLIDDLLTFARIGRTEMKVQPVQLAELISEVREELRAEIGARVIEWKIGALPLVSGDRALLHQVVANLVGNAVKFTRPRSVASIEIGATAPRPGDTTAIFFVRDNGVGFNPTYLDKLFGVFQRLHHQKEFEGTGIGLANVKRIITRHGGRVWAEGSVDKGAVFYFTLTASPT